ncbi:MULTISPECIES: 50S ribosomal protein L18 [Dethiosulfovibrio]|jgi:large subunit ribosomal protein L18|uniref:Large ribosomal subunit protein uL18 n=3 Tax=Dethiosulfovibrio TaxID=47054 RepID=D2Z929_9BACT|nr:MULTISPECIES: 50S ribosomal protein L18 [Dethiosulfovibrio]EFC91976.1 ribosomal protein L18 [Dethiosulfovibrio peptidovorans DSM 11002]MCF4113022.1 50S ribosomal protein L18 [Dethiosulfovibrio russensis]MCF4141486.1 50S ribosomal protein L18 [Dethiosulfovibrio marinus]MCF4144442.1 50S ribosomal protein L18 [Dethiosulfovibrio acidaminovorans]
MIKIKGRNRMRVVRHLRLRRKLKGTSERPRMSVFRSLNEIYVQIIDDTVGRTLASASTLDKALKAELQVHGTVDAAKAVGELVARRALDKGISEVVFDRGGHMYHGRVKALAEAAREAGLKL